MRESQVVAGVLVIVGRRIGPFGCGDYGGNYAGCIGGRDSSRSLDSLRLASSSHLLTTIGSPLIAITCSATGN